MAEKVLRKCSSAIQARRSPTRPPVNLFQGILVPLRHRLFGCARHLVKDANFIQPSFPTAIQQRTRCRGNPTRPHVNASNSGQQPRPVQLSIQVASPRDSHVSACAIIPAPERRAQRRHQTSRHQEVEGGVSVFATIGRSFRLVKLCLHVLSVDKELAFFPIFLLHRRYSLSS